MAIFEYKCRNTECLIQTHLTTERGDRNRCPECRLKTYRVFSVGIAPVMQEHYNPSVGKPISSMSQFKSELAKASDEATERTGIPHDFQPCDPQDRNQK